jgi:hypothetical protein
LTPAASLRHLMHRGRVGPGSVLSSRHDGAQHRASCGALPDDVDGFGEVAEVRGLFGQRSAHVGLDRGPQPREGRGVVAQEPIDGRLVVRAISGCGRRDRVLRLLTAGGLGGSVAGAVSARERLGRGDDTGLARVDRGG